MTLRGAQIFALDSSGIRIGINVCSDIVSRKIQFIAESLYG